MAITIKTFFDPDTATFTHIVSDPSTHKAAIIDSVLDYNQYSGRTSTKSADQVIFYIKKIILLLNGFSIPIFMLIILQLLII